MKGAAWVVVGVVLGGAEGEGAGLSGGQVEDVVRGAGQVVERHLAGCHLVLAAARPSPGLSPLLRNLAVVGAAAIVVEIGTSELEYKRLERTPRKKSGLERGLWGHGRATCRALLLDHTAGDTATTARLLSWSKVWRQPETRVVVMGGREGVDPLFQHSAFRNTRHALYITPHASLSHAWQGGGEPLHAGRGTVEAYRRCLYCEAGEAGVQLLHRWNLTAGVPEQWDMFREDQEDFMGHRLRIVAKNYFPYFSYERVTDVPGTLVNPKDSLNNRIITHLAEHLNFTYEVREPEDGQWGLPTSGGNWTGLVGTLQHEKADFSVDITVTRERSAVVGFAVIYIDESVIILSSKPRPLPEYLSLVRPLEGEVWAVVVGSVLAWGAVLWLLQGVWAWASGGRQYSLASSLFYGWGLLLEDRPFEPPPNPTGQVLVGWWLLFCLIVTTAYRSSLISHLVVKGKSPVINSMEDLALRGETQAWTWGTKRMTGVLKTFLSSSLDPALALVYQRMETVGVDEGMNKVLEGGFSYIYNSYFSKTLVATRYTDPAGYTPVHISATQYPLFSGNAWAFRFGAPFRGRFSKAKRAVLEAGLVTYWMDGVISRHVREERRRGREESAGGPQQPLITAGDGQVVLGLRHLQATFYVLFLGHAAAALILLAEHLLHRH